MRFNGQGDFERKIRLGTLPKWPWRAPQPVTGDAPSLVFEIPAGEETIALSPIRVTDTVDGISDDRRTLTKAAADLPAAQGVQGSLWGQAFLITAGSGIHPIQVEHITSGQLVLAERLPNNVVISVASPATVQWRHHIGTITEAVSASETSTAGAIRWRVDYTGLGPVGVGSLPGQRDEGIVHVVPRIFSPKVDIERLAAPGFVGSKPSSRDDWEAQIDTAHAELVQYIRTAYRGERREDALDPGRFVLPLLRLSTALILERVEPEESSRQRIEAFKAIDEALRAPSLTQPGAVSAGEGGVDTSTIGAFYAPADDADFSGPDF